MSQTFREIFGAGLACMVLAAAMPTAQGAVGEVVPSFTLKDVHGRDLSSEELLAGKRAAVLAFIGTECPLAKLYAPRLIELSEEFGTQGVAFILVDSNSQDSLEKLTQFAKDHGVKLPLGKDLGNVLADAVQVQRTPEVVLLDADRQVVYQGRIDDQFGLGSTSGYAKPSLTRRDLAEAITEVLAGEPVTVAVTEATGCRIGRVSKVTPHGEVTFASHIAGILNRRCVTCHRPGEVAPFSLLDPEEVVGWAAMIQEVVHEGRMPPWFANPRHGTFQNDPRLSEEEKGWIDTWITNGMPIGDPGDIPEPPQFAQGWQIPQPDLILPMSDRPYQVPAEGVVNYQYFMVDPGFTEDKWIQAAEARPGNRSVVHHIIVFVQPPGGRERGEGRFGGIAGYAPGATGTHHPEGVAAMIPAGSKLVFQMHYTPNGTPQEDVSVVGFKFADPKTVRKRAQGGMVSNRWFSIPPGASEHPVEAKYVFKADAVLTSLKPHMHVRGKSFRYEVEFPDGQREILLDIPNYDFNWQLGYILKEPRLMPAGTVLNCRATFDNSADNIANPDPEATVRWGDQTWEEMMIGFFNAVPVEENGPAAAGGE